MSVITGVDIFHGNCEFSSGSYGWLAYTAATDVVAGAVIIVDIRKMRYLWKP